MTRRLPERRPASAFKRQREQTTGLALNAQRYVLDANGDCVFVSGPDISQVPTGCYGSSPTMQATGLSGAGAASKSSGTWKQL